MRKMSTSWWREGENPSTRKFQKLLKSANHPRIQQEATNRNTQDKEELTNFGATVKYKYSHIRAKSQSFSRLAPPLSPGAAVKSLREPKRQQWSGKTGLSGWISVRITQKNWLVRAKLCRTSLWKIRLREWSSVRLFWESKIMKMKFCQFDLWLLFCTGVVLSGKLFRIKTCFDYILFSLVCCASSRSVNWFTLFAFEGFTFFRHHLGMLQRKWAMLLFVPP